MKLDPLFSVPFWQDSYPEFNRDKKEFLDFVHSFRKQNPNGDAMSNLNGYQSNKSIESIKSIQNNLRPVFDHVYWMTLNACKDLDFVDCNVFFGSTWININDNRSCSNLEHTHPECTFSGVFYLKVPENSGYFYVKNTSINDFWGGLSLNKRNNPFNSPRIGMKPSEGDIFLFPSYLPHSVSSNLHDDERISISFNITVRPKES